MIKIRGLLIASPVQGIFSHRALMILEIVIARPKRKAFKYKLRVSRAVDGKLTATLGVCRELYNAALQERRDAYRVAGVSLNYETQANQLPDIKRERSDVAA